MSTIEETPVATTGVIVEDVSMASSETAETVEVVAAETAETADAAETAEATESTEQQQEAAVSNEEQEKFAAKFAALTRKEKEVRTREAKLQQQMQELQQKLDAIAQQQKEVENYRALPDRLKREPLKVMEESGLTFQQLAEMVLNDGKPTQDMIMQEYEKKVMSKVQELEQKLAEKEAKEAQERHEAALGQFKAQLTDFVNNSPEYELIKAHDAVETVYEVIEQHYAETNEILSNKEASDAVEEYLLEEAKKLVDREKVKKLLQPQQPKVEAPKGKPQTTLSNAQAAQAPKTTTARKLSNEESMMEAAKLLKWTE